MIYIRYDSIVSVRFVFDTIIERLSIRLHTHTRTHTHTHIHTHTHTRTHTQVPRKCASNRGRDSSSGRKARGRQDKHVQEPPLRRYTRRHTHKKSLFSGFVEQMCWGTEFFENFCQASLCRIPHFFFLFLFFFSLPGFLVPNPSCDFAGSETLYEFVGQVEPACRLQWCAGCVCT
jgi:hypothetical protein